MDIVRIVRKWRIAGEPLAFCRGPMPVIRYRSISQQSFGSRNENPPHKIESISQYSRVRDRSDSVSINSASYAIESCCTGSEVERREERSQETRAVQDSEVDSRPGSLRDRARIA